MNLCLYTRLTHLIIAALCKFFRAGLTKPYNSDPLCPSMYIQAAIFYCGLSQPLRTRKNMGQALGKHSWSPAQFPLREIKANNFDSFGDKVSCTQASLELTMYLMVMLIF